MRSALFAVLAVAVCLSLAGGVWGWQVVGIWLADKIIPGIVLAGIIGWVIPRAMERYKGRRDHLYKTVDTLRDLVKAYQKTAADSWRKPQTRSSLDEIEAELETSEEEIIALMKVATDSGMSGLYNGSLSIGAKAVNTMKALAIGVSPAPGVSRPPDYGQAARVNKAGTALIALLVSERWAALKGR